MGGKAVREQPSFLISLRVAAASYVSAGRSENVHQAIAQASIRSKHARFPISRIASCDFDKNISWTPSARRGCRSKSPRSIRDDHPWPLPTRRSSRFASDTDELPDRTPARFIHGNALTFTVNSLTVVPREFRCRSPVG